MNKKEPEGCDKLEKLEKSLRNLKCVAVSFSGGVDSSLLAFVSQDVLGSNAIAVTIDSFTLPRSELKNAKKVAEEIGIEHLIVKHDVNDENFLKNPVDRCYYCKKSDLKILKEIAREKNIKYVADGTNADDLKEERHGIRALKEEGVVSPLADAQLGKQEIRELARKFGLTTAEKPPTACLASRIPCGKRLTKKRLKIIEKAEEAVNQSLNSNAVVRVRDHEGTAKIECSDTQLILKNKNKIIEKLMDIGFEYVIIDPEGYKGNI